MHGKSGGVQVSIDAMTAAAGFVDLPPQAGIVVQDANGEIVAASERAQAILGLEFDEMRGRTSLDPRWAAVDETGQFVEGAQHPAVVALTTRAAVRNRIIGIHLPGGDAVGHHVWLEVDAVPVFRDDDPAPWVVVAVFTPIGGERLRTLELRDSERLFRRIAEHSSDMVAWQRVPDTTFLWVSPACGTVLGFAPDELIGTRGIDLVHPDDLGPLGEAWRASVTGVLPTFTMRMRHADGSYRWIETTAHVLPSQEDRSAQMITAHRNVSDRVTAERARDSVVRMFELAMTYATIGVGWRRWDGTLSRVNPALCTILGRSADELVGHSLREFAADDESVRDDAVAAVRAGILSHHESERRFRRPDGTVAWCLHTVIGLPDEAGVITHFLVQLLDITEQKTAAAQLERAALTDPLTGLPNRTVLEGRLSDALTEARAAGTFVGVLFIDIDRFKRVNDTFGHDAGDELLREVGRRLSSAVRHSDTVVRLGGDEFVVVREHLSFTGQLDGLTARIGEVFAAPFAVNDHELIVDASVGSACGNDLAADQLLSRADEAMYRVKRNRRPDV
ncbi:diguanylate cyclase (GGDEF)-like protein/PAS domain S-box-containing protein [Mycolicibacterium sp. BK634]|uniref:sensor domain-containing protein n=1 Tax=Mycolicibacterium sp. BK634 TaxID=2587099 RepID=UPI00183A40A4|nr:diguanylate cyclase (GGDEF)-like protein/PAS domain S-box-containing protein [Mycolicibacterium sp. BK634]